MKVIKADESENLRYKFFTLIKNEKIDLYPGEQVWIRTPFRRFKSELEYIMFLPLEHMVDSLLLQNTTTFNRNDAYKKIFNMHPGIDESTKLYVYGFRNGGGDVFIFEE